MYKMPEDKFFESAWIALNGKKDVNTFHEGYKRRRIYEQDLAILEELTDTSLDLIASVTFSPFNKTLPSSA